MNKFFLFLSLYYFLFFTLIGDYVIFLPKYLSLFLSPFEIGIIFAMMPIARFLTPFIFLKKPLNKNDFLISIIISTFASFLILTKQFYILIIAFFLIGASFSIIFPYIEAIAIEKLQEKYGKSRLFGSIGFMLFGIIAGYISFNLVYFYIVLMILTNLISLYFLEDKSIKKSTSSINLLKEKKFWLALILMQISFGGFYNFFTIINIKAGISKNLIGWLWAIGVIAEILIFIYQEKFIKKFKPLFWIKLSIFLTSIRWVILNFVVGNFFLVALTQLIHSFSFAIFHTASLLYLSQKYANKTLAQQFYAGIGYGLAAFLGSLISGILYGENLFLYEGVIAFVGFLIML